MGINVSHGSNQYDQEVRSATHVGELGKQLAHVLSAREWKQIAPLFDGTFRSPATITPEDAARCADTLYRAADHRLMPREWVEDAELFGDAARRAAMAGEPWTWD